MVKVWLQEEREEQVASKNRVHDKLVPPIKFIFEAKKSGTFFLLNTLTQLFNKNTIHNIINIMT